MPFQNNHGTNPAEGTNYADMLAKAVNAQGAGTYYLSIDAKSASSTLANDYSFYIKLRSKNVYTDEDTIAVCTTSYAALPLVNEGFATSSMIFDLTGDYNWLRTDVYLAGSANTLSGQQLYLDNTKLLCLRQEYICQHDWVDATCTTPKTCSICGEIEGEALGHSYTGKVTTAPTCGKEGVKTYTCSGCGHSYTEKIAATGAHTYGQQTDCTVAVKCSVCGTVIYAAKDHVYDNDNDASCNTCGAVRELTNVTITKIESEITPMAIIPGYKNYVGADWQAALQLPTELTVTLSTGEPATVAVLWDYAPLGNLTAIGKYTLTGTLVSDKYLNTDGITAKQIILIREYQNLLYTPVSKRALSTRLLPVGAVLLRAMIAPAITPIPRRRPPNNL